AGGFFTLIAYSRAGSIVFWRTVDGHVENPGRLSGTVSVSAGALVALSFVIVVLAGPITRYTDATAAQLHNSSDYIEILKTPMVGKEE
ncbi:MAG: monovalent cation/H+ antiporter subunit D, partial [Marinobacter sp.]|nr:monovalent cation/H+ antiporter subunit D [Marinobacter sp.]